MRSRVNEFAPIPVTDEAEHEIRRSVARYHAQINEINELQTDLRSYQLRAQVAEADVERLNKHVADLERKLETYSNALAALRAQWQTGVQVWVSGFDALKALDLPQLQTIPPPQQLLEKVEA